MNNAENGARRVDLFGDRWPEKEGQVDDPNSGGDDQERMVPLSHGDIKACAVPNAHQ